MHCSIIYCNLHYRNDGGFDMWSCRRIDNGNCSGSYIEHTENGVNACYLLISMAQNVYGSWYEIDQTTLDACIKLTTLQVGTVNCQSVMKKATTRTAKEMHKIAEAEEHCRRNTPWKNVENGKQSTDCMKFQWRASHRRRRYCVSYALCIPRNFIHHVLDENYKMLIEKVLFYLFHVEHTRTPVRTANHMCNVFIATISCIVWSAARSTPNIVFFIAEIRFVVSSCNVLSRAAARNE